MGEELRARKELRRLEGVTFEKDGQLEIDELMELRRQVGWPVKGDYREVLEESVFYICARSKGRLVGFVQVVGSPHGDLLIHDLCVHPAHQGQGIGSRLVELALKGCAGLSPKGVNVLFEEKDIQFFRRLGFRILYGGYIDGATLQTSFTNDP
jgi:ribosomal protein S18 acetylase RimI-like enzyme